MKSLRLVTVLGARPQFVKAAAVSRAVAAHNAAGAGRPIDEAILHTGQHYDANMSAVFFEELAIPAPSWNLVVGSGPHGRQTGQMLERIEAVLIEARPDVVMVYGDTNSTLAGALAAAKLHIPIAHVEAGLRSFNRRMPEEINRVVADQLAAWLFCPTQTAVANLEREGLTRGVHQTGDVMYDSVRYHAAQARAKSDILRRLGLAERKYALATIHRAENTDDPARLGGILAALAEWPMPVVLPMHPRTRAILRGNEAIGGSVADGDVSRPDRLRRIDPVPYLDMLELERGAAMILTDSGGVQKEAYWFGVPCITLRDETEWVELVEVGANRLVGADPAAIRAAAEWAERWTPPDGPALYGDGHAAEAIVRILAGVGPS